MRRVREVLRIHAELGANVSAVAAGAGLARSTVRLYLRHAAAAGIDATTANRLSDEALKAALFPPVVVDNERPTPDWAAIDEELRRHKHVTRKLLWLEYKSAHPEGYEFSQFKLLLSRWQKSSGRGLSMRQVYRAGETVQVDYAGDTVTVMDGGAQRQAQIFVACLPCSGLIYSEANIENRLCFGVENGCPAQRLSQDSRATERHWMACRAARWFVFDSVRGNHSPPRQGDETLRCSVGLVSTMRIDGDRRDILRPSDPGRISLWHTGDRSAFDGDPLHVAPLGIIVVDGVVLRRAVVPHGDGVSFPVVAILIFRHDGLAEEEIEQRPAFVFLHAVDAYGELGVDEQHLLARHRMHAHHRVQHRRVQQFEVLKVFPFIF